jgi:hypothetical protein
MDLPRQIHTHTYIHTHIYIYIYTYTYRNIFIYVKPWVYEDILAYTYIYLYIHTYIYIFMVSVSQTSLGRLIFRYIRLWMLIHYFKMEAPARGIRGSKQPGPWCLKSRFPLLVCIWITFFPRLQYWNHCLYIYILDQHQQDHGSRNEFVFLLVPGKHSVAPKARLTHKYNTIG